MLFKPILSDKKILCAIAYYALVVIAVGNFETVGRELFERDYHVPAPGNYFVFFTHKIKPNFWECHSIQPTFRFVCSRINYNYVFIRNTHYHTGMVVIFVKPTNNNR